MTDSRERQTSNLLALRDGELIGEAERQALLERADARAELAELEAMGQSLRALPDVQPDDEVWERIQAHARAGASVSGVDSSDSPTVGAVTTAAAGSGESARVIRPIGFFRRVQAPYAMAAGLLLTVTVSLLGFNVVREAPGVNPVGDPTLDALLERSRRLEPLAQPRASTGGDPSERALRFRIADVDTQLSDYPAGAGANRQEVRELWSQRVALLESLAEVRRARAAMQPAVY